MAGKQCCFCGNWIANVGDDPVTLTLASPTDSEASQILWAHAMCLQQRVHGSVSLNVSLPDALEDLPRELALKSASASEIVLPYNEAMQALEALRAAGRCVVSWEGWIRSVDGRVGHGDAPSGTTDLSSLDPDDALEIARKTMREAFDVWQSSTAHSDAELLFCITVAESNTL